MADVVRVIANDDGTYTRVYSDGTSETYDPLAMMNSGAAPAQGTTTITTSGKAVPVQGSAAAPPVDPAQAAPTSAPVTTSPSSGGTWYDTGYQGHSSGGGSAYRGGGGYSGSSYGGGAGTSGGGVSGYSGAGFGARVSSDPFAGLPSYANGTQHPYQSGQPLVPGGSYRGPNPQDGGGGAHQIYTGNVAAGPYDTHGDPGPSQHSYGGDSTQGGGGSNAGANSDIGQAMRAKVEGMANKIQGGGSSSSTTTTQQTQHQYNQQGRQMDRASARYNDALYNPDPLPVHGWSKQQGFKAGTINAALADPTMLLPAVFPGYASGDNPFSDSLESQPMTDLAMIMYGTQNKRGLTTKTPVVKVPHILAQNGTKPTKPATKRTLDPSEVTNKVAHMWGDLGAGSSLESTPFLDRDTLLGNLATARRGSALRQGIAQQFKTGDEGGALNSIRNYVGSAVTAGPDDIIHRALGADVDRRITTMGPELLRMKPKKASRFVSDLAGSYLNGTT